MSTDENNASLDRIEKARLLREIERLRQVNVELKAGNQPIESENEELKKEIEELKAQMEILMNAFEHSEKHLADDRKRFMETIEQRDIQIAALQNDDRPQSFMSESDIVEYLRNMVKQKDFRIAELDRQVINLQGLYLRSTNREKNSNCYEIDLLCEQHAKEIKQYQQIIKRWKISILKSSELLEQQVEEIIKNQPQNVQEVCHLRLERTLESEHYKGMIMQLEAKIMMLEKALPLGNVLTDEQKFVLWLEECRKNKQK